MTTNIIPIASELRACYGVCCDLHARCARYAAVNGSRQLDPLGTCMTNDGYPKFVERPTADDLNLPHDGGVVIGRLVRTLAAA